MKHKDGMTKLRNKIMITFLVILFAISVFDSLIEVLMSLLESYAGQYPELAVSAVIGVLVLNLAVYVICGYVFFRIIKKNIRKESDRQTQEKDLIYAAIAHDLKTPMTSVQGFAKALSDGRVKPEEQQEIFDIIYRKSDSMNDMVNTLFAYAKLGTESYQPVMAQVDLCSLVRDIAAENFTDFEEHDIALDIDIPDAAIMINADKNELKRAVTNLIVNVYKHNPDGIKARISVGRENGRAVIRIADSGNALPEDVNIFEPFITENAARTIGHGTGLGLAITKRIIERHGGELYVDTEDEGYTKGFVVRVLTCTV